MLFKSQQSALDELKTLSDYDRQSILIEGPVGSGKSYLARYYASLVKVDDFIQIDPKVGEVRSAVDECISNGTRLVLCIENLDTGVSGASYAMLKFLEEPIPGVYIIITCRNIKMIPDTIISRSACVSVQPPVPSDIAEYAKTSSPDKYNLVKDNIVWRCCSSFSEADEILKMTKDKLDYYQSLSSMCKFTDNVSTIVWKLSHYESSEPCNVELAIRCVMNACKSPFITKCGIECIRDLNASRIAQHAILAKFAFNCKYCE